MAASLFAQPKTLYCEQERPSSFTKALTVHWDQEPVCSRARSVE